MRFVKLRRCRRHWLSGAALINALSSAIAFGQSGPQIYLFAATPTPNRTQTFPARVYRVKPTKTLELIREVVSGSDGVYSVSDGGGVLALLYPFVLPRSIAVVHKNDPARVDNLPFNPDALPVYGFATSLASLNSETVQILPLNGSSGPGWPKKLNFVRAVLEPVTASPRVMAGPGSDYEHVLVMGAAGGPASGMNLLGAIAGNDIVIDASQAKPKVDTLAPSVPIANKSVQVLIVGANAGFLVILKLQTEQEMNSLPATTQNYVHDRKRNFWKTVEVPGNESRQRIFGEWLATIEETWHPNNESNPGRDQERGYQTRNLPNVRAAYAFGEGANAEIPGILILTNLKDGRRITVETHSEDSEILDVEQNQFLYRVNDTIYQADINGNALGPASVLAKDEDVPEVHWVFRSK